jgi:hypothetical protein
MAFKVCIQFVKKIGIVKILMKIVLPENVTSNKIKQLFTEWVSKNPLSDDPITKTFVAFFAIRVVASLHVSKYSRFTKPQDFSVPPVESWENHNK